MTVQAPPVATGMVIETLEGIKSEIRQLSDRMQAPAPGMFRCGTVNRTHIRMRVAHWVLAVTAAAPDVVALQVGSSIVATVTVTPEQATIILPLPITIERGTDVVAVPTAGTVNESFLIYFPE